MVTLAIGVRVPWYVAVVTFLESVVVTDVSFDMDNVAEDNAGAGRTRGAPST